MADAPQPADRVERRKKRTRAALIRAAQGFIAEGQFNVPVLDITQAADRKGFWRSLGSLLPGVALCRYRCGHSVPSNSVRLVRQRT